MAKRSPEQHARNLLNPFRPRKPVMSWAAQMAGLCIFPSLISFHTLIHPRCCLLGTSQNFPVSLFSSCLSPSQMTAQISVLHVLMSETEDIYGEASWCARAVPWSPQLFHGWKSWREEKILDHLMCLTLNHPLVTRKLEWIFVFLRQCFIKFCWSRWQVLWMENQEI